MRRSCAVGAAVALALLCAAPALGDGSITFQYPAYTPSTVRIAPGQSVTWTPATNNDFAPLYGTTHHPLHFLDGTSETSATDTSYTRMFTAAGKYGFYCGNHGTPQLTGMAGTVVVTSNTPPTASFTATPTTVASGGTVQFDASGSSDPDVTAGTQTLSYSWDLNGDGQYGDATGPTASMAYTNASGAPMTVTVGLKVTDSNSDAVGPESDTTTRTITVQPPGSSGGAGAGGTGAGGTGASTPDTTPPAVSLAIVHPPRAGLIARRGVVLHFTDSEAGSAAATLRIARLTLAKGSSKVVLAGVQAMVLHATRGGEARLRRVRRGQRLRATLTLVVSDLAGNRRTVTRRLTLRG